ncbi:hypothetical protein [Bauldia litoralis]|uniref:Uncharacterized protein n=1 Tax=Bauldia litoralis TaxID=665467 RepID=A0A1G6D408_9HYPH|nr:hypothetical protein [Bauldia litoralis]SDB39893.1 hypothetical protein SAMN02982931_02984 [Bauldia litoralis]
MATRIAGDIGGRATPGRGVLRRVLGRMMSAREERARQSINAYLLGLDDATLATFGYDRKAIEEAGSGRFPL